MYNFTKTVVNFRKEQQLWDQDYVERYAANDFYCFSRGKTLLAFTNSGSQKNYTITYHPFAVGDKICNIFYETDCITISSSGAPIVLTGGEVKLYKLVSSSE
jgi:hypothetical protein